MTIFYFFSPFLSLFLYNDIGRGQLNMQLNKSDDDGGGDSKEEEEEEEEKEGGAAQTMKSPLVADMASVQ